MNRTQLYIECDCCGKKIYVGNKTYRQDGYCAIYCSAECYVHSLYAPKIEHLSLDLAQNCNCKVHQETIKSVTVDKVVNDKELTKEELEMLVEMEAKDAKNG